MIPAQLLAKISTNMAKSIGTKRMNSLEPIMSRATSLRTKS